MAINYLPTYLLNYLPSTYLLHTSSTNYLLPASSTTYQVPTTCFNNYFTKTEVVFLWCCCWCLKLLLHRPWHSGWWARLEGRWLCLSPLLLLLLLLLSYPCFVSHLHRPLHSWSLLLLLLLQVLATPSPLQQTTLFDACGKYLASHHLHIRSTYHRFLYFFLHIMSLPQFLNLWKNVVEFMDGALGFRVSSRILFFWPSSSCTAGGSSSTWEYLCLSPIFTSVKQCCVVHGLCMRV